MSKKLSYIAIVYFLAGVVFAFIYALYYHWPILSFFSPGFYMVILTWPFQVLGFLADIQQYGLTGKPL